MKLPLPKEYYSINDINYKGHKIRTYRFGIGQKKVLSLPGYPQSGLIYLYFLLKYDLKKVTFITLDIPGWIGNSDNVFEKQDYDEDILIDIISKVIGKYRLNDFSVIGYSFGSSLAARIVGLNRFKIEKLALVSPVLHGNRIEDRRWLLNLIRSLKLYSYFQLHINHRFRIYRARLKLYGIDEKTLNEYFNMLNKADAKVLFESINKLFTSDYSNYLQKFDSKNILIASSRKESKFLRDQAKYLRESLIGENSLYLYGSHEDFIINPSGKTVEELMSFLVD